MKLIDEFILLARSGFFCLSFVFLVCVWRRTSKVGLRSQKKLLWTERDGLQVIHIICINAGKSELEKASLYSLKLLETALQKQESYLSALRQSSGSMLGSRMDKLMLAINTRSSRSDHLVNIAKSVASHSHLCRRRH